MSAPRPPPAPANPNHILRALPWVVALAASLAAALFGALAHQRRAAHAAGETERALAVAATGLARAELAERTLLAERIIAELAERARQVADPSRLEIIALTPAANAAGRARGTLVWDPAPATGLLVVAELPVVGAEQIYRLWLHPDDGGAPAPAGAFRPAITGRARLVVPARMPAAAAAAFTVTLEPAAATGGAPAGPVVLRGTRATGP